MFPSSRDFSRVGLHGCFRDQYADFEHDVFWLSRGFLDARLKCLFTVRRERLGADGPPIRAPQPSHMMLSLRHMLAIMEIVFIRDTPCLGRRRPESPEDFLDDNEFRGFHRVIRIHWKKLLRNLTVLVPQTPDEWAGKADYEALEHRPFGTSVEEREAVLGLARTPRDLPESKPSGTSPRDLRDRDKSQKTAMHFIYIHKEARFKTSSPQIISPRICFRTALLLG